MMTFNQWWESHGEHNATLNGSATRRTKELMQLAFEVGQEQKFEAVAAERERWTADICNALAVLRSGNAELAGRVLAELVGA